MNWHKDLPPTTEKVWDIMAKALLLRVGGSVIVSERDMKNAADTPCEIAIGENGDFHFRVEAN